MSAHVHGKDCRAVNDDRARRFPREWHERAIRMVLAAYAEAGYPNVTADWDAEANQHFLDGECPTEVLNCAKALVLTRLGVPWHWSCEEAREAAS